MKRASFLRAVLVCSGAFPAFTAIATPAAAQSSIGIYRDTGGSNCTLSTPSSGIIEAYVVVRPGPNGATAVEFSAPKPACFNATFLEDVEAPGTLLLGDSQTGAAVSLLGCHQAPMHVLTIRYAAAGPTAACCEYPILPDPTSGATTVVDCSYELESSTGMVSTLNPDQSCLCTGNSAPQQAQNPAPQDDGLNVSVFQTLAWIAWDIDDNIAEYDLYFGTDAAPPLVAPRLTAPAYDPGQLEPFTKYYWRVVVRDAGGMEADGVVWKFTTRAINSPPAAPRSPIPAAGATGVSVTPSLQWAAGDIDGDALTFDVYFGASTDPPLVSADQSPTSFHPPELAFSTVYYWRIVARDSWGLETPGPTWSFTTRPANYPPNVPHSPVPPKGSQDRPFDTTLSWTATDPDADTLVFDVYFGTTVPLPLIATGVPEPRYALTGLEPLTWFTWSVVARDPSGAERAGPAWTFRTRPENYPPNPPASPVPSNGSTSRPLTQTLSWTGTDPDGDPLTYDVYFGTSSPPPLVADSLTTNTFTPPGPLAFLTRYYWRVVAHDSRGASATGSTWSFTTRANAAPNPPGNPRPAHMSAVLDVSALTWTATDPDGQPLTFDVYFGTSSTPPRVASGLTTRSWTPGPLETATRYYWRVVAFDGYTFRGSPTWYFTVVLPGDANGDGEVTLADAACAFRTSIWDAACSGQHGGTAANVDCSYRLTPRDARCIHKHVLDGSCAFCGGDGEAPSSPTFTPVVSQGSTWVDDDTLVVELNVSGVPSFESFFFEVIANFYDPRYPEFVRAERRGATVGWDELDATGAQAYAFVGGYALTGVNATTAQPFVRLRFIIPPYPADVVMGNFDDDLSGAGYFVITVGGGSIPVLISRFDARVRGEGVELAWELGGDETAERFTVLRRAGSADLPAIVGEGAVVGAAGSWVDTSVEPGATYHYELLLRTSDGQEFRSQVVTVTMADYALALGQNHPNPFNPTTVIPYTLPGRTPARVRLLILDVSGRVVRTLVDEEQAGGTREAVWDGRDDRGGPVSSGVYFYVLDADKKRLTRKLVLLK